MSDDHTAQFSKIKHKTTLPSEQNTEYNTQDTKPRKPKSAHSLVGKRRPEERA